MDGGHDGARDSGAGDGVCEHCNYIGCPGGYACPLAALDAWRDRSGTPPYTDWKAALATAYPSLKDRVMVLSAYTRLLRLEIRLCEEVPEVASPESPRKKLKRTQPRVYVADDK